MAFDKDADFIGRDVLLRQKETSLKRRLVLFALEDPERLLYHDEPIWRDRELVGCTTSGMFGHTLGCAIGLGYVANTDGVTAGFIESGSYEIEIACERTPARASLHPFYDPKSARVRM